MNDINLIEKLYEISGPVLQLRIASELMDKPPCDIEELAQKALDQTEVQKYMEYYRNGASQGSSFNYKKMLHGATPDKLGNVAGKLWSLGMRQGVPALDHLLKPYISIMEKDFYSTNVNRAGYGIYYLAQFLSLLGYADVDSVACILQMRLDQIVDFVKQGRYDIYVDVKGYPKLPSSWRNISKIIDPALTQYGEAKGEPPLPSLYDLLGIAGMKQVGMTAENEAKAELILKYCFDERYQKGILNQYGILLTPAGQYYSMGWSVHMPGYGQVLNKDAEINKLLLWADILSPFKASRELTLFKNLVEFLEDYKTKDGFYCFPRKFIPDEKRGYFVSGKYMGLNEERTKKEANLAESTFRALRLKKNLGMQA